MANKQSESMKNYYDALVDKGAKEVVKQEDAGKGKVDVKAIITALLESDDIFKDQDSRFTRDVKNKVEEMKKKAKDEREKKIVLDYEGKIQEEGDILRAAGVQKNFKFRIRAGNIVGKVLGHSVDARKLNDLMQDIQRIEDGMEKKKIELAQLRAARDATSTMIGTETLGLNVRVTKGSLVKQIYAAKRNAQGGWRSFFNTESNMYDSYKAAAEIKDRHEAEYQVGEKLATKKLEADIKELKTKKEVLEAALKRVEALRQDGRAIFESTFGNELNVLADGRETMGEEVFIERIKELQGKVDQFGKETGFVKMDYFMQEALEKRQIELDMFKPREYLKPQNAVETGRERVRLGKWYEEVFAKKPSEGDVSALIEKLRGNGKDNAMFLKGIASGKKAPNAEVFNAIMRFLFTGKDTNDVKILPAGRRAPLNAENIVKYLEPVGSTLKITTDSGALQTYMEKFVNERDAGPDDFVYSVEEFAGNHERKELSKERLEKLAPVWEKLTGQTLEEKDADSANTIYESMRAIKGAETEMVFNRMNKMPRERQDFIKFFYTGKYHNNTHSGLEGLKLDSPPQVANFLNLFDKAEKLFEDTPQPSELNEICRRLRDKAKDDDQPLAQLLDDENLLVNMLAKVREPKKSRKDKIKDRDEKIRELEKQLKKLRNEPANNNAGEKDEEEAA